MIERYDDRENDQRFCTNSMNGTEHPPRPFGKGNCLGFEIRGG